MKRKDLMKRFLDNGWRILREGGNHTVVTNGTDVEFIPRHTEIKENLAKAIIKRWVLK